MTVDAAYTEQTLLALLTTPSFARQEAAVADLVERKLAALGLSVERDDAPSAMPDGGQVGNLLCRVPGTVDAPALLFNSHLDTVGPTEDLKLVIADGVIRTDGTTILGGDDKAGVAAILGGLEAVLGAGAPHPPLEILFTVQEEIGLWGAKAFDVGRLKAKMGFVFDHGVPLGEVCVSAPSQTNAEIAFFGRAAHAGVEPENGINAIACAADAIGRIRQGRIDFETTANIGVISGGRATNIVPEECRLKAEVRSRNADKLAAHLAHLKASCEAAAEAFGCRLEFATNESYQGFSIGLEEPVARLAGAAIAAAGLEVSHVQGGGGSDANVFCAKGLRCLLMACGERQPHTTAEHLHLADVVTAARVAAQVMVLGAEARCG
jgi:tripeptide aminopeptidase